MQLNGKNDKTVYYFTKGSINQDKYISQKKHLFDINLYIYRFCGDC